MTRTKDYAGIKLHHLTFIKPTSERYKYAVIWEALCDCGNTCYTIPNGKTMSCGKKCVTNIKNWAGKKYNMLTFIRPTDERTDHGIVWELLCDCGNLTYAIPFDIAAQHKKSCGCNRSNVAKENGKKNTWSRKYDCIISSARRVWMSSTYRKDCDFEVFFRISQEPCYYCGRLPHRTFNVAIKSRSGQRNALRYKNEDQLTYGNFTYNGLDRVDNAKGHSEDNIVPCCYSCNKSKSDLTFDEFIAHIERMYQHTRRFRKPST